MGIRFLCSHCQKRLNVKSGLAGEYCFCPDCHKEIQVPLASTVPRSNKRSKRGAAGAANPSADVGHEALVVDAPGPVVETTQFYAAGIGSSQIAAEVLESLPAAESESEQLAEEETRLAREKAACQADRLGEEENARRADEQAAAFLAAETVERQNLQTAGVADLEVEGAERASQSFLLAKPVTKIEEDPLKAEPTLIWYLRDRIFGEKGPLKAYQVERMLETGQLRAGAILWREDWNDWLPAEEIFPQLAEPASKSSYEIPEELNPHSEVNRKQRSRQRFWRAFNAAAVFLIVVLVYYLVKVMN